MWSIEIFDLFCVFFFFGSVETYPSESIRAELSEKLGLSDRQLQMWFCHRRLKDKKEGGPVPGPAKKQRKSVAALPEPPVDELAHGSEPGSDYGSGSGSGSSPFGHAERNVVSRSVVEDLPRRRHYESQQSITELRAIAIVEAQLGEPLRDDGPVLGIEFDQVPPDAFGAPLGITIRSPYSLYSSIHNAFYLTHILCLLCLSKMILMTIFSD